MDVCMCIGGESVFSPCVGISIALSIEYELRMHNINDGWQRQNASYEMSSFNKSIENNDNNNNYNQKRRKRKKITNSAEVLLCVQQNKTKKIIDS